MELARDEVRGVELASGGEKGRCEGVVACGDELWVVCVGVTYSKINKQKNLKLKLN